MEVVSVDPDNDKQALAALLAREAALENWRNTVFVVWGARMGINTMVAVLTKEH